MNKKFFTLIASACLLVASLGTVSAQLSTGADATAIPMNNDNRYQVYGAASTGSGYLTVSEKGYLYLMDQSVAAQYITLSEALWCIQPSDENLGQNPIFDFNQKLYQYNLVVAPEDKDLTDSVSVALGYLGGWGFSKTYTADLEKEKPLYTYYKADSVLVLTLLDPNTGAVGVKPFLATAINVGGAAYTDPDVILFTVEEPAPVVLTARDYNTLLGSRSTEDWVKLKFNPDHKGITGFQNPWSDRWLKAHDDATAEYLLFEVKDPAAGNKWLRVDTSHVNSSGTRFLAFAYGKDTITSVIANQYKFRAEYFVSNDSLAITVMEAYFNANPQPGVLWTTTYKTEASTGAAEMDSLSLKRQDLVTGQASIITVGPTPVNTKIELGASKCGSSDPNLTSIDEDLYVIHRTLTSGEKQYLVVPIYTDTLNVSGVKWLTIDPTVEDPMQMPAFQWAVEKIRPNTPAISPLKITNREYGANTGGPVVHDVRLQLTLTDMGQLLYGEKVTSANFTAVPKAIKANKNLGYKFFTKEEQKLGSFDLNYLHRFNDEKYLRVAPSDSFLLVGDEKEQFVFADKGGDAVQYGYYTTKIKDLSKLERQSYVLGKKDGRVVVTDNEDRYALGKAPYTYGRGDSAVFFFKVHNTYKKQGAVAAQDYYALVDTGGVYLYDLGVRKMGINDAKTWNFVQVQKETRTSSFAINEYIAPLYRKFDGEGHNYGPAKIAEPYGTTASAPLYLKFMHKFNNGVEFLFENSQYGLGNNPPETTENDYRLDINDKTISFLGLYNAVQFPEVKDRFSYSFYVDTAYVKRPHLAGGEKETAKPQYMLALRPEILKGDTIWCNHTNADGTPAHINLQDSLDCPHTIKRTAMTIGDYLFNAQDSIGHVYATPGNLGDGTNPHNPDYVGKRAYGVEGATRLAFVKGVHSQDTLYVLRGTLAKMTNAQLAERLSTTDLHRLPESDKHWLGQNTHYKPRHDRNGVPQKYTSNSYYDGRNGKSMVFQFRLFNPSEDRTFIIESVQNDDVEMGPDQAQWIKSHNGVMIMTEVMTYLEAKTNNQAMVFDVTNKDVDNQAVGNEEAEVAGVKVVAGYGEVTVYGAAGKTVSVSNILGQVVASKALTSDQETIALPKGIAVVAVAGEKAVKAVVK